MSNVAKTSDRVDVVRCGECWKRDTDNCPVEFYWDNHPADDAFFCAEGERDFQPIRIYKSGPFTGIGKRKGR